MSLIGSIIGSAAGIALGGLGCMFAGFPLVINLGTVGFCILFSVCIGIVFGVYPARKAAMMRPVEALRYE